MFNQNELNYIQIVFSNLQFPVGSSREMLIAENILKKIQEKKENNLKIEK